MLFSILLAPRGPEQRLDALDCKLVVPSFECRACPLQPVKVRTSKWNARSWLGRDGRQRGDDRGDQLVQAVAACGGDDTDRSARQRRIGRLPGCGQVGLDR